MLFRIAIMERYAFAYRTSSPIVVTDLFLVQYL